MIQKKPNKDPSQRGPHSTPTSASTSWETVGKWYNSSVGEDGHYYHQAVIIPGVLRLMNLRKEDSVLDIACGQGILARHLPQGIAYAGIDISPSLLKSAKQLDKNPLHHYHLGDAVKPLPIQKTDFTHSAIILALQNIQSVELTLKNIAKHLKPGGKLFIVLNHPCFRIPRQSSWGVDEPKKIQYRRLDRYSSSLEIPIQAHPGKGHQSEQTLTFHHPLSYYSQCLLQAGFLIETIEEWCSDKQSTGKKARMEDRARQEFPLFLTIGAIKKN
jgi:SAM-dependent methyltransferase